MTKQEVLKILDYAKNNKVSEKTAAVKLGYGPIKLTNYKKQFNIPVRLAQELKVSEDDLKKLIDYCKKNGATVEEGKKALNLKFTKSIRFYCKRYGIEWKQPMTKERIEEVLQYSQEHQIPEKEACKIFGIKAKGMHQFKKRLGIEVNPIGNAPFTARCKRVYKVDDNFFEAPNMLNCYYAGFLAADGCISQSKRLCSIGLARKDREWVVNFKKDINFEGPVRDYISKDKFPNSSIVINSPKIVDDLEKNFNIVPSKSLILRHPNITDNRLIDAFICGYIDGDGSIGYCPRGDKQKSLVFAILGTLDMVTWIKKRVSEIVGKEIGCISHKKTHSDSVHTYSFTDRNARKIFLEYYRLNVPKLERKWSKDKYEYCINYHKRLPICRRKGVNIFNLDGKFIKHFDTLIEAQNFTGVNFSRISTLCKINDNHHESNGYMFSREMKESIPPFEPTRFINKRLLKNK